MIQGRRLKEQIHLLVAWWYALQILANIAGHFFVYRKKSSQRRYKNSVCPCGKMEAEAHHGGSRCVVRTSRALDREKKEENKKERIKIPNGENDVGNSRRPD
jgi:hypothetical protein